MRKLLIASVAVASLISGVATVQAHGSEKRNPDSQYRHDVMELVKYSGLSILNGLRGKAPVPDAHYAGQANILKNAAILSKSSWEKDTRGSEGRDDSKPAVWEDYADFTSRMDDLVKHSTHLETAANAGDKEEMTKAVRMVFGTCKGCHDKYRVEH